MDCNPSAPSTSKNTNMNIRRKTTTKKQKKINVETWQLVPELASSQTLASLEGTGQALTCCCEEKLKPYSLIVWGGEVRICQQEFSPPTKPSGVAMRAAGFRGLWAQYKNMSWKHKMILFHLLMAKHNTNNRHCGVKHKRQASVSCFIQVL